MLTERRRTVRKQYEAQQQRRALLDTTNQHRGGATVTRDAPATQTPAGYALLVLPGPSPFHLDRGQRLQLQQQVQQVGVCVCVCECVGMFTVARLTTTQFPSVRLCLHRFFYLAFGLWSLSTVGLVDMTIYTI